jgi:ATP-dependent HslUV protease ATP-binding subunit HslU
MSLPIEELTPRQIVAELDRYIVGQTSAKKAVAVALRNRYRRLQLPESERQDVMPKNILMIGPTGVGKTEIARRLAQLARAPFVKVEATKFTEVGYVGRDVESIIRDLTAAAVRLVETERSEAVREDAERKAEDRLVEMIDEEENGPMPYYFDEAAAQESQARQEKRENIRARLKAGEFENREVSFDSDEAAPSFLQVFTPGGMEEMGIDSNALGGAFGGSRRVSRRATVGEARVALIEESAKELLDKGSLHREAVDRAEQTGIVFIDEIDKVAGRSGGSGPDVSREGVQRDLLPIIEGSTVQTKFGPVRTDHILFVAAGAFHISKPSDLIPELQGRMPIRVELEPLAEGDFRRILIEPRNALVKQYTKLLAVDGVSLSITDDGISEIARLATEVNLRTENIGARRLHTMLERLLEEVLFDAPDTDEKNIRFDAVKVKERLGPMVENRERSRSVL